MGNELRANIYFWIPEDTRNYGDFAFSATEKGVQNLRSLVSQVLEGNSSQEFVVLALATIDDVDEIGGGIVHSFKQLKIARDPADREEVEVLVDRAQDLIFLKICRQSMDGFEEILGLVERGTGDCSIEICHDGVDDPSMYCWPCFGHIQKTKEPTNSYPE